MGIFESLTSLAGNVAKVVAAPVEVALDLADAIVTPVAEAAEEIIKDVKSIKD